MENAAGHLVDADDEFIRRFTRSQRALHAFIIGMTPTRSDADDILQEVNLALWKKRHLYDSGQDFLRWAFGFAVVEIRSFRCRIANRRLWFSDAVLDSLAAEWPSQSELQEHRRDALVSCLEKLVTREKQFVAAFYRREATAQQLADESGKPLRTVYNTLERAREWLRRCVQNTLAQSQHP